METIVGILDLPQPHLSDLIWNTSTLQIKQEVRDFLLGLIYNELSNYHPKIVLKDALIYGGMASCHYSEGNRGSDIDISLYISNLSELYIREDEIQEKFKEKEFFFPNSPTPIHLFIKSRSESETIGEASENVYSILRRKWISPLPKPIDVDPFQENTSWIENAEENAMIIDALISRLHRVEFRNSGA